MVPSLSITWSLSEGENILIIKKLIKEDRVICIWANLVHILRRPILAISNTTTTEGPPDGDRLLFLTGENGFHKRAVLEGKLLLAGLFQFTWEIPRTEEPGGYSPRGCKELHTNEHTHIHTCR